MSRSSSAQPCSYMEKKDNKTDKRRSICTLIFHKMFSLQLAEILWGRPGRKNKSIRAVDLQPNHRLLTPLALCQLRWRQQFNHPRQPTTRPTLWPGMEGENSSVGQLWKNLIYSCFRQHLLYDNKVQNYFSLHFHFPSWIGVPVPATKKVDI